MNREDLKGEWIESILYYRDSRRVKRNFNITISRFKNDYGYECEIETTIFSNGRVRTTYWLLDPDGKQIYHSSTNGQQGTRSDSNSRDCIKDKIIEDYNSKHKDEVSLIEEIPLTQMIQEKRKSFTQEDFVNPLLKEYDREFIDITDFLPLPIAFISTETARKYKCLPLRIESDGTLLVAVPPSASITTEDSLRLDLGRDVYTVTANENNILDAIDRYYGIEEFSENEIFVGKSKPISLKEIKEIFG